MNIPEAQTLVDKLAHKKFFIAIFTVWQLSTMYSPGDDWKLKALLIVGMIALAMGTVYCQMKLDEKDEPIRE